jgi:hypothetical protein
MGIEGWIGVQRQRVLILGQWKLACLCEAGVWDEQMAVG